MSNLSINKKYISNTNLFLTLIIGFTLLSNTSSALLVKDGKAILEKLDDYELCQTRDYTGNFCNEALTDWVEKTPADAFTAGKLTRKHMNHWGAIPFFDKAWKLGQGKCEDSDVKLAVLSALTQSSTNRKVVVDQALDISLNHCENQMSQDVLNLAKTNDEALKNSCKMLTSKKLLTGVAAKKCSKI